MTSFKHTSVRDHSAWSRPPQLRFLPSRAGRDPFLPVGNVQGPQRFPPPVPMSPLPRPKQPRSETRPTLAGGPAGLQPTETPIPLLDKETGLRPLGQVDGLQAIEPTTAIFPSPAGEAEPTQRQRARRLATTLDWQPVHDDPQQD